MLMVKIGLLVWSGLASADNSMELSAEANLDSSNSSTTLEPFLCILVQHTACLECRSYFVVWIGLWW